MKNNKTMKKLIFTILAFVTIISNAQDLEALTYEQGNNYDDFIKLKKGKLMSYTGIDGTILKIGDTIVLGEPTGGNGGYYSSFVLGDQMGKSTGGFGGFINDGKEDNSVFVPKKYKHQKAIIVKMKYEHDGSKKKPIIVRIAIDPIHGSFGMNKRATSHNVDETLEQKELIHKSTPIEREYAIKLLKETKEELDLGILTKEEFNKRKEYLIKIIRAE